MNAFESAIRIARLRFALLFRQRVGSVAVMLCVTASVASLLFAKASYLAPQRIFWDFTLGSCFVTGTFLALYLGSQLFADEQNRRTLHLVLAAGVARRSWLIGNFLGIGAGLSCLVVLWSILSALLSEWIFGSAPWLIVGQIQGAFVLELSMVLLGAMLLSLWVRPVLALLASAVMTLFLHSVASIDRIFSDPESGHLIEASGLKWVLVVARWLPPLEWFDLRLFVGFQNSIDWSVLGLLAMTSLLWTLALGFWSVTRFEGMDL